MKNEPIIQNRPKRSKKSSRNLNLIIFILVFLGIIVAVPYYFLTPKKETFKLQQFEQAQVRRQDFRKNVSASGTVIADEKAVVKNRIAGTVVGLFFEVGDLVNQGDLLVELASEDVVEEFRKAKTDYQKKIQEEKRLVLEHQRNIDQYDQDIAQAEVDYQRLKAKLPTWEKLFELGEISKLTLEEERSKVELAEKKIDQLIATKQYAIEKNQLEKDGLAESIVASKKEIEKLEADLESCKITAPIAGKVVSLPVKLGENVQAVSTILELIDDQSLLVVGQVSQKVIDAVKVDQKVQINTGNEIYPGRVTSIAQIANEGKIEVQVEFDQVPAGLRPQTTANLDIQVGLFKDSLALPRGRYLSSGLERFVYQIAGDRAEKVEVTFGLINGNFIQVKSGLEEDAWIITSSYDNFIHLEEIEINPEGGFEND